MIRPTPTALLTSVREMVYRKASTRVMGDVMRHRVAELLRAIRVHATSGPHRNTTVEAIAARVAANIDADTLHNLTKRDMDTLIHYAKTITQEPTR